MFFKRKKSEPKPLCFHKWKVADFGVGYSYNGIEEESYDYYDIGCVICGSSRRLDSFEYSRMVSAGILKEESE
jgi:hypothetical protein